MVGQRRSFPPAAAQSMRLLLLLVLLLLPIATQSAPTAASSFANLDTSVNRYPSADNSDNLPTPTAANSPELNGEDSTVERTTRRATTNDLLESGDQTIQPHKPLADDMLSTKVLLDGIETLSTEPTSARAQLSEHDYSSIKANDLNTTTTSTDGQSGTAIKAQSITVSTPQPDELIPVSTTTMTTSAAGPRKKIRRSTTTTSTTVSTPLINTSAWTGEDVPVDIITTPVTLPPTISTTIPDDEASIGSVSPRPRTKKLKKKLSKKDDSDPTTPTQPSDFPTISQFGDESTGMDLLRRNVSDVDETTTTVSIIRSASKELDEDAITRPPTGDTSSTESLELAEEHIKPIKKPRKKPKFIKKIDQIDSAMNSEQDISIPAIVEPSVPTGTSSQEETSTQNVDELTATESPSTKTYLTTESFSTTGATETPTHASPSTVNHPGPVSTSSTTEFEYLSKSREADNYKSVLVTQTPSEVLLSSRTSPPDQLQRQTSTTLFADESTITATTEFISLQSMEPEPEIFSTGETITGTDESINNEDIHSTAAPTTTTNSTYPTSIAAEASNEEATIPTTEPRVEGINVENVEESLSPIAEDDVLVVEIEESGEAADVTEQTTAYTTISTRPPVVATHGTPSQRPKLNDELFFPIEVQGVPGNSNAEPTGNSDDDDARNDNDGDFDLEAEIFPTIPPPKNTLFESEILREKGDLKEDSSELANIQVVSTSSAVPPTTRTQAPETTTTTRATVKPAAPTTDRTEETNGNTGATQDLDVSTVGHDSDTFFYISNTEVKVVKSVDATSSEPKPHKELSFPENTDEEDVFITFSDQNHSDRSVAADQLNHHQLQENIILSPITNINSEVGGGGGGERHTDFDYVKFNAPEAPQKLPTSADGDAVEFEAEEEPRSGQIEEQLSFIRVEETTDTYSSEEGFEFLHNDRDGAVEGRAGSSEARETSRERSKDEQIPDVIIEPYPQLDTDNDLPFAIGVPVIAELPPQIELSVNEDEISPYAGVNQPPSNYHHFDIDNKEVEKTLETNYKAKPNSKSKKVKGKKKPSKKAKLDQFPDTIFENADNYLVKNPSISLEVPALDFNFTKFLTSTTTLVPNLNFTNETTLVLEEDIPGLNDIQTLFLACFITLMLLVFAVIAAFIARFMWRKHYSHGSGLIGDNSTDPLAAKSRTLSVDELKSSESGLSHFKNHSSTDQQHGNGIGVANTTLLTHLGGGGEAAGGAAANGTTAKGQQHSSNNYAAGANGSIITMTLKNNHLIVETEERNDMSRDARETKMHYSPSDKDGVFVVEVARGADTSYHSPQTTTAGGHQFNGVDLLNNSSSYNSSCTQEQRVQVHQVAPEMVAITNGKVDCSTGLSQSDLSDSSSAGSNKGYQYGGGKEPYSLDMKSNTTNTVTAAIHSHRPVAKQETIDLEPRLQSDIDLFNDMETERREHCNGTAKIESSVPDIILVKSAITAAPAEKKPVAS